MIMKENIPFLPKFLKGEPLPEGYSNPIDPFSDPPKWHVNLRALAEYAEAKGVHIAELSKKEYHMFTN